MTRWWEPAVWLKRSIAQISVPFRIDAFRRELALFVGWYNEHRRHASFDGRTPEEVYFGREVVSRQAGFGPRSKWLRGSPCAASDAPLDGDPGVLFELNIEFAEDRRHLPVGSISRAQRARSVAARSPCAQPPRVPDFTSRCQRSITTRPRPRRIQRSIPA